MCDMSYSVSDASMKARGFFQGFHWLGFDAICRTHLAWFFGGVSQTEIDEGMGIVFFFFRLKDLRSLQIPIPQKVIESL